MISLVFLKFNDSSPNKEDCENGASSGDRRSAQDYENEEDTIDEETNSGDKKMHQMMKMKKIQLLKQQTLKIQLLKKQTLAMEEVHWMMKMKKRYVMKKQNLVQSIKGKKRIFLGKLRLHKKSLKTKTQKNLNQKVA